MNTRSLTNIRNALRSFNADQAGDLEILLLAKCALRLSIDLMDDVADTTDTEDVRIDLINRTRALVNSNQEANSLDFNLEHWIQDFET